MTGAGAGHEMTGAGAGQHTGCMTIGLGQQQSSSSSSASTLVWNPVSVIIRDNASPTKTGYFILLVIIYLHRSDRFTGGDEHASLSRDYDRASDILAGRGLRREEGCRFAMASAASECDRRWRVAVRLCRPFQAFQLRFSAMRQDYSGLHFHHRLRYAAATRRLPLVEAVKLLLAYQGS